MIQFENKWMLLALLVIPFYIFLQHYFTKKYATKIPFSKASYLLRTLVKGSKFSSLDIIRYLALTILIFSLSEPQIESGTKVEGIWQRSDTDVVICLDVSGSMLAETYNQFSSKRGLSNRLEDAKMVIDNFIEGLNNQQVALVTFSNSAEILTPLSDDYNLVSTKCNEIAINRNQQALTSIGMGIALSSAILKDSPAKSKFIILITDGVNTTGQYSPLEATKSFAVPFDIRIYPIGFDASAAMVKSSVDIETLNEIAKLTGTGQAGRASSSKDLDDLVKKISESEKIHEKKELPVAYKSIHVYLLILSLILLFVELIARKVLYYEFQ